jgi:hypothetical protein
MTKGKIKTINIQGSAAPFKGGEFDTFKNKSRNYYSFEFGCWLSPVFKLSEIIDYKPHY